MNLLVRINLALTTAFALAAVGVGASCYSMLQGNAKREALREAGLMMDSALSMRAYTSEEIVPLLNAQMAKDFLPQSVPSYAATQNFLKLRAHHPEYAYREATLNPTNLRDRAADWEGDLVQQFRNDPHYARDHRRARYSHGPLALPRTPDHRGAEVPGLPQRARGCAGNAAGALRQQ